MSRVAVSLTKITRSTKPVQILRSPQELSVAVDQLRTHGQTIAMVPTMGALHAGHLSLFVVARQKADIVIATIFVNPLQFNNPDDFAKYPLQLDLDVAMLKEQGVDVLYAPSAESMYGRDFSTSVHIDGITEVLEGRSRPGHFSGVATVVTKLLSAGRPDLAVFGQKDFQQCAVIKRLVADLDMPIEIVIAPTVREKDGLAMSSRNIRLSTSARREAAAISQGMLAAQALFTSGIRESERLIEAVESIIAKTSAEIDYVKLVDAKTLQDSPIASEGCVIVVAVVFDDVRLIDNHVVA
jgi:pantoate--beta-alanine ligase